jgi:aerobic-type carbon monoxide dehydrogenase small subunit (CoxS/CutS family)
MSDEKAKPEEAQKISRRKFVIGVGAGVVVGAAAVAGAESYMLVKPSTTTTTVTSTSTVTGPISTVTGPTTTKTSTVTGPTTTVTTTVAPPAITVAFAASPTTVQAGGSVTFSVTPSGGTSPYTVSIQCGDGTALTAAGSHTYASAGNYTALVTVTDSKGQEVMAATTVVVSAPLTYTQAITLNVNGTDRQLVVDNRQSLLDALRDQLGLTGTKDGCDEMGECGACAVLADGKAILSCLMLATKAQGMAITTIEGLVNSTTGALDPVQSSFVNNVGFQCGYCTPGMIMTAKGLLAEIHNPTQQQVMNYLGGNICRCGGYPEIISSVLAAGGSG